MGDAILCCVILISMDPQRLTFDVFSNILSAGVGLEVQGRDYRERDWRGLAFIQFVDGTLIWRVRVGDAGDRYSAPRREALFGWAYVTLFGHLRDALRREASVLRAVALNEETGAIIETFQLPNGEDLQSGERARRLAGRIDDVALGRNVRRRVEGPPPRYADEPDAPNADDLFTAYTTRSDGKTAKCPVCFRKFKPSPDDREPIVLPCSHLVCKECVNRLPAAPLAPVPCPVCRTPFRASTAHRLAAEEPERTILSGGTSYNRVRGRVVRRKQRRTTSRRKLRAR